LYVIFRSSIYTSPCAFIYVFCIEQNSFFLFSTLSLSPMSHRASKLQNCKRTWCLDILFGVVFKKFMVYFAEEMSDFRLCCGLYISPWIFEFILWEVKLVTQLKLKPFRCPTSHSSGTCWRRRPGVEWGADVERGRFWEKVYGV